MRVIYLYKQKVVKLYKIDFSKTSKFKIMLFLRTTRI